MAIKDIFNKGKKVFANKREPDKMEVSHQTETEYFQRSIKTYYMRPHLIGKDYQECLKRAGTDISELEAQYKKVKSIMSWYEFAQEEHDNLMMLLDKAEKNFKEAPSYTVVEEHTAELTKDRILSFHQSMRIFMEALRVFFPVVKVKTLMGSYEFMANHIPATPLAWEEMRSGYAEAFFNEETEINYRYNKIAYTIWSQLNGREIARLLEDGVWSHKNMKHTIEWTNMVLEKILKEHENISVLCENILTEKNGKGQNPALAVTKSKSR